MFVKVNILGYQYDIIAKDIAKDIKPKDLFYRDRDEYLFFITMYSESVEELTM